ncbi:hypothetical protein D3C87_78490 [compost metagenome]
MTEYKKIKYIHGSEDSLDVDVLYVFEEMPTFTECQKFCSNEEENRNIVVVKNGVVKDCFKGTIDEINNGLLSTYNLHPQSYENIITRKLERDIVIKAVRVVRCLLSHCSRTQYRTDVKKALKNFSWNERIKIIESIDFTTINDYGKSRSKEDVLKTFAFQLGQFFGLMEGVEHYTKSSIAKSYPSLKKYLYREKDSNIDDLANEIDILIHLLLSMNVKEVDNYVTFIDFNKSIDLINEKYK